MTYPVGYRRPPSSSQFKKGASGNPKGRPKGSRNVQTLLEEHLQRRIVVTEAGRKKSVTRLEAIVMRLVAQAVQGDLKQTQLLLGILGRNVSAGLDDSELLLPANLDLALEDYIARHAGLTNTRPQLTADEAPSAKTGSAQDGRAILGPS